MPIFDPPIFIDDPFIEAAPPSTGLSIKVIANEIAAATTWADLHITETIGEPDRLTVAGVGFPVDPAITLPLITLFGPNAAVDNYYYIVVMDGDEVLFSGLGRKVGRSKVTKGAVKYALSADGWEFLAPKRLVGVPGGDVYLIQGADAVDQLPTAIAVDGNAIGRPMAGSVAALWHAYWRYPTIDVTTFVEDVLFTDEITWSGSDLAGATSELAALGSAAALWWLANDSPLALWTEGDPSPGLALHFGVVAMPDDGDSGDDLLAGFPSADQPSVIAPYHIDNDNPDWVTTIMPLSLDVEVDYSQRDDATYVRGATGFTEEILAAPISFPVPYQVGPVIEGGTGWVGSPGGIWGESYIDAPAAISPDQRDSFGNAYIASRSTPRVTGTIRIGGGYDGWHKGQAVKVTDEDYGLADHWMLIRSVDITQKSPGADFEYTLTVGDTLTASLGFALRQQRLAEQRKPIDPGVDFKTLTADLLLAPGGSGPVTCVFVTASGKELPVKGVNATWFLLVNGVDQADPFDTGATFYLTDQTTVTDESGFIYAVLHAGAGATAADAATAHAHIAGAP